MQPPPTWKTAPMPGFIINPTAIKDAMPRFTNNKAAPPTLPVTSRGLGSQPRPPHLPFGQRGCVPPPDPSSLSLNLRVIHWQATPHPPANVTHSDQTRSDQRRWCRGQQPGGPHCARRCHRDWSAISSHIILRQIRSAHGCQKPGKRRSSCWPEERGPSPGSVSAPPWRE